MIQNNKYYKTQLNDISRIERKNLLLNQLKDILLQTDLNKQEIKLAECRTKRIINFLLNYTDLKNLSDIKKEHFLKFMKYSVEKSYLNLSLKDIKNEIELLQKVLEGKTKEEIRINMSIGNYELWIHLLPRKNGKGQ